jgi:two-component system, LytTR family, sensor kinase
LKRHGWRVAASAGAVLVVLFALQQWLGGPLLARRNLTLGTALALQAIIWGAWLLLLPAIVRVANRHPLTGRPTPGWWLQSAVEGLGFVLAHSLMSAVARWAFGLAVSNALGDVVVNTLSAGFASNVLRYAAILLVYQAVSYHQAVSAREQRAARLEADLARAQLTNVEACLRPHFLFNTLNTIAALVREDPSLAEKMIGELGDLLRASLTAEPQRQVRLDEELAFTQKYLDIEKVRFQDRLNVRIDATDEARRALVPHLILQPLVENAVRHGVAPLEAGGSIAVEAARLNGMLRVTVRDDGAGFDALGQNPGAGIGLRGVRARLAHAYGDEGRLQLAPGSPAGTIATFDIPYRTAG